MSTRIAMRRFPLPWVLGALGAFFLLAQLALFWGFTVDDAFISFRYARNLAQGHGLVFNVGERVEGYSNPLWVILLALPASLGLDIVEASKGLGVLAILGTVAFSITLLRRFSDDWLYGAGLGLLLASSFGIVFYGISGLETLPLALLIAAGAFFFVRAGFRISWPAMACFHLAALTRPEGILYGLVAVLFDGFTHRTLGRKRALVLGAWGALLAAFLLWRYTYYGDWLPNTFYAKPPRGIPILPAMPDVHRFLLYNGGALFLALALVPCLSGPRRRLATFLWSQVLVGLAFMLYSGGDWMESYRYLVPILPLYSVLAVEGLRQVVQAVDAHFPPAGHALAAGPLILLSLVHLGEGATFWWERDRYPNFVMTSEDLVEAGKWVRAHYPSDYTIVCWRIGALAYHSELNLIDNGIGLTDRFVARLVYTGTYGQETMDAYLRQRNPELFMDGGWKGEVPRQTIEVGGREYRFVQQFPQGSEQWWFLYERADLASGN